MKRHYVPLLLSLGLAPSPMLAGELPPELGVEILDHRVLPQSEVDGLKFSEISALAYDPASGALYGLSDKSILFRIAFAHDGEKITEIAPQQGWPLLDEAGVRMKSKVFNPEGADLRPGGAGLVVVSENGPRAALFDLQGRWQSAVELPQPLQDATLQRSDRDGLELLAEHPVFGLLSATEEPPADAPRSHHVIHASDGSSFAYDTSDIGNTNIKSITLDDQDRLLVLERHRDQNSDRLQPYLRLIDPAACHASQECPGVKAGFSLDGFENADFEGMTGLGDDLYLIVSDDKVDGQQRSVFALVKLTAD